jgi:hypothetical protein
MSERSIRFGVTDHKGHRAATWKCWTQVGSGKKDVYLTCRALRGSVKLSLHESGHWHVAFDANLFPALFEQGAEPASRFAGKWDKPVPLIHGLTLACRVHTPWYGVTVPVESLDGDVFWIQAPPQGQSIEVAVFLSEADTDIADWPGRRSMNTSLVGSFELDGGGHVWIVHHSVPLVEPSLPPASAPKYFRGAGEEDLYEEGTRAVTWGDSSDGSVVFFEGPVLVRKNP